MDSARFDRWTKLFALRMSRRTATVAVGTVTLASLTSPRWVLGQDDDDDDDTGVDQHKDNPTGEDPDDGQSDDDGEEDTSDDDLDGVGSESTCLDVTRCKLSDGFGDVGKIPGGPYRQEWRWVPPGCVIVDQSVANLTNQCFQAYSECQTGAGCVPCADYAAIGCR